MAVNLSIFNSKSMQRFLPKALLFVLLLAGLDRGLGAILQHFYSKTLYGENWPKQNWLLSSRFDVVILGSSRTFRHYVPSIIERELGRTVFNAGENGQYLLYAIALGNLILERYAPKVIILDMLPSFLVELPDTDLEWDRLEILLPYADDPTVSDMLNRKSRFESIKRLSKLYRFNSIVLNIADNIRNGPQDYDNGYVSIGVPRYRPKNPFILDTIDEQFIRPDSLKRALLVSFIKKAQQRGATVVMSFSPSLAPVSDRVARQLDAFDRLADELDIPFLAIRTEEFPEFADQTLFMDYIHMNAQGAEKFSAVFARQLAEIMQTKPKPPAGLSLQGVVENK